jgi:dephospho-CoA kinase
MLKVGLTGGIGSGKTTVAKVFSVLGIPVFSSDEAGRSLLREDRDVRSEVAEAFGPAVLVDGVPDRKALASLVFHDAAALERLNKIIHPAVRKSFAAWAERQQAPYVINEAAILVETGTHRQLDRLVVVEAPEHDRLMRVAKRDGTSEAEVLARMRNQANDEQRRKEADFILANDGNSLLIPQILAVHQQLLGIEQP